VEFPDGELVDVVLGERASYTRHPCGGGPLVHWRLDSQQRDA
jgi:hypothetical protein